MMAFECSKLDLRNYEDRKTLLVKACEKIAKVEDRIDRGTLYYKAFIID